MRSKAISLTLSRSGCVTSVQPSAQAVKKSRRACVTRSLPHSALELAERLPPTSLPDVDLSQVQEGKLPWLVAFGLLSLFKPRDRLVQLVLVHQIEPRGGVRVGGRNREF